MAWVATEERLARRLGSPVAVAAGFDAVASLVIMVWVSAEFLQSVVSPQSCVAGVACVSGLFLCGHFCSPMPPYWPASGGVLEGSQVGSLGLLAVTGAKLVVATFVLQVYSARQDI